MFHLKRKRQRLKKTGQFSYVMTVELVHIFGEGEGPQFQNNMEKIWICLHCFDKSEI